MTPAMSASNEQSGSETGSALQGFFYTVSVPVFPPFSLHIALKQKQLNKYQALKKPGANGCM